MNKKTLKDINVQGQTVLVRVDFNVPMDGAVITDNGRIVAALETINYLIDQQAKIVLFAHRGRVKTEEDKALTDLAPIAKHLSELLHQEVAFSPVTRGPVLEDAIAALKGGDVLLVQNTRYEDLDGRKESTNDEELGKYWASLGDVFVNDAFGTAHRAHASNVGIASHLDSAVGFLIQKELEVIGGAIDQPKRPLVAILGGAKVSDKIRAIENLLPKADKVIVGGGMAYTFLKAQGFEIGKSLLEEDQIGFAQRVMREAGDKLVLPVDITVADDFSNDANTQIVNANEIPADWEGLDSGPASIRLFTEVLAGAKTVIWNGPLGVFEIPAFSKGTVGLAKAIANLNDAITIVGGGDSAAAVKDLGFEEDFTHISTGGGASLTYLEGSPLPGINAIADK